MEKRAMPKRDAFGGYHPLVTFLYFGLMIGFSMFFMHPFCLFISVFTALTYSVRLYGGRATIKALGYAAPLVLLAACINPLLNHQGTIVIRTLPTGSAVTLESLLYGLAAGFLLVAVLTWFRCYAAVMTSDKFLYLFGRILPSLSLLLSMTLRFVPRFRARMEEVRQAQACLGQDPATRRRRDRIRQALTCFSILVTWSLESGIETADSMKGRGYGLPGRSAFSVYRITKRDLWMLSWLILCGALVLAGSLTGQLSWQYFPAFQGCRTEPWTLGTLLAYLALGITPWIINRREERRWQFLTSNI
jgi:energy-coupling factor transport system permease protein